MYILISPSRPFVPGKPFPPVIPLEPSNPSFPLLPLIWIHAPEAGSFIYTIFVLVSTQIETPSAGVASFPGTPGPPGKPSFPSLPLIFTQSPVVVSLI